MNKALFYIIFLLLSFNFSCKKELKKTKVDGILRDFITGNPLAGVEVYLQEYEYNQVSTFVINKSTYMSTVTGSDGKFEFEYRALKNKAYGLEYQKPSECYFDYDDPYFIPNGEKTSIDWKLHSKTTLYLHIKNISPYDSNDEFCYHFNKEISTCPFTPIMGTSVDFFDEVLSRDGYEMVYIKSFITKNSILTIRLDSIVLNPCVNDTLQIFY